MGLFTWEISERRITNVIPITDGKTKARSISDVIQLTVSFITSREVQQFFSHFVLKFGFLYELSETSLFWLVLEDAKGIAYAPPHKSREQTEASVNNSETHCTWTEDRADEEIVCFVVPSADLESYEDDKQPESVLFSLICWMVLC